ncbi:MAG TPA: hypothetical protein VMY41_19405 [Thermohalobaculum sp.]|nr:hypothetical protein [Thermohalobaculum sp.]
MTRYAIIGWGSLIWDPENIAPHVQGDWAMGGGPVLPMEFTRVSIKRNMALAVCLDVVHGVGCITNAIASVRDEIGPVISDLARRERAPDHHIGAVCLASGHANGTSAAMVADVRKWCQARGWTGAVWTDLPSNFTEHLGQEFNIPRAIAYLRGLTGDSLDQAVSYIEQAPAATDTPLRRVLNADDWWLAEARRLNLR